MLVTFSCDSYVNVILFGDIAVQLLKLMGHTGTVPSALLAQDVSRARQNLQKAVDEARNHPTDTPEVSLVNRALPLLALLDSAEINRCNVMWS